MMLKPAQVSAGAWGVRGSGVGWESWVERSLTRFVVVGWEGELLELFGVPSSTSAHSAGVEDKGDYCLLALGEYQHREQNCNVYYLDIFAAQLHLVKKEMGRCEHKKEPRMEKRKISINSSTTQWN